MKLLKDKNKDNSIESIIDIIELKYHLDETGSLTELVKLVNSSNIKFSELKVTIIKLKSLAIKAYYVHKTESSFIYISPSYKVKLVVIDIRDDPGLITNLQSIVLGDNTNRLIKIPPGVACGIQTIGNNPATVLYFTDFNQTQEEYLPYNYFGLKIWE